MNLADCGLFRQTAYINGCWVEKRHTFTVFNPASDIPIAQIADLSADLVPSTIDAAHTALATWQSAGAHHRARILRRWFELILQHTEDLARLLVAEQGKPRHEALAEIRYGASFVEWFAEEAKRIDGDLLTSPQSSQRLMVMKQPVGVCAAITPWNFPVAMVTRKVAPALAAGCTVILKPAEQTPLSALALAELAHRAGVPAGVLNVLTCSAENVAQVGAALCASPVVRHLSFTGSTEIGRQLMAQCAPTMKSIRTRLQKVSSFR